MTGDDFWPLLILPPSFVACLKVSQNREGNPCEASVKTFRPRYSFCVTRFAGLWQVQGWCQGATPDSSCLMIFSVMISYTLGIGLAPVLICCFRALSGHKKQHALLKAVLVVVRGCQAPERIRAKPGRTWKRARLGVPSGAAQAGFTVGADNGLSCAE
jgi:hypothetical protein